MRRNLFMAISLGVVLAFIFIATFARTIIKPPKGTPPVDKVPSATPDDLGLVFAQKTADGVDDPDPFNVYKTEVHVEGHYDFWFQNQNKNRVPVKLGFLRVRVPCCTSGVQYCLETKDFKAWTKGQFEGVASLFGSLISITPGIRPLEAATVAVQRGVGRGEPKRTWAQLGSEESEAVTIQPGESGWVRLPWKGKATGAKPLQADVWVDKRTNPIELRVPVYFVEPVEIQQTVFPVGEMSMDDDLGSRELYVYIYSYTRPEFDVKVDTSSRFLTWDGQSPMMDVARMGMIGPIMGGYRLRVTFHPRSKDGHELDLGRFRETMLVSSSVCPEPFLVSVVGQVRSLVSVIPTVDEPSPEKEGRIDLGMFRVEEGKTVEARVEAPADYELKLDQGPQFAKIQFKPLPSSSRIKTWLLHVEVPPNEANGDFPRDDDPRFRDSAVYLHVKWDSGERRLRIPLSGKATYR
jgi:hypothetical protein